MSFTPPAVAFTVFMVVGIFFFFYDAKTSGWSGGWRFYVIGIMSILLMILTLLQIVGWIR